MLDTALSAKMIYRKQNGFSLVELLAVIAIMGVLTTLSITGLSSLVSSNHLNEATTVVQGQLELARQTAKTLNRSVQLRFYKDQNNTASAPSIDSLQIVVPAESSSTEQDQPVERPTLLPRGIIIADSTNDLSLTPFATGSPTFAAFNPQPPNYYTDCYILTFSPTGAITETNGTSTIYPAPNANGSTVYWSLTLVAQGPYRALGSGASASQLKNYATFYLNSINGTYSCVRP